MGNRNSKIFIGSIILVHALFYILAQHFGKIFNGDSSEYINEAHNIQHYFFFYSGNASLPIVTEYITQRQPGYPLFLLLFYFFNAGNWLVLLFQNLLSVFNVLYFRKSIIDAGYNKKYDWLLLLLITAYPIQFMYANTIAPDILLQTFVVIYFAQFLLFIKHKTLKYALFMGLTLALGFMVKPVLYPFVVLHIIILLAVAIKQKLKTQRIIAAALLPVIALLFYNYWNYTRTGKFHFSSNTAFNAVYYYYDYFRDTKGMDSAEHFLQAQRADIAAIPNYSERYDYANEQGTQLLKDNFAPYMFYHLKNSARIFIEPGKGEIDLFTGTLTLEKLYSKKQEGFYATLKDKGWPGMGQYMSDNKSLFVVAIVFLFNLLRLLGLLLFFFSKKIDIQLRLFVFILLSYFAIAAGPIANTHYFLPVSLIAIGCSVIGFQYYFQNRKTLQHN